MHARFNYDYRHIDYRLRGWFYFKVLFMNGICSFRHYAAIFGTKGGEAEGLSFMRAGLGADVM